MQSSVKTLDDIIEHDVDESLYLTKSDFMKRKYLRNSLDICCTVDGEDVYIYRDDIRPPKILKIKRTEEQKKFRRQNGDRGVKFGKGQYLDVTKNGNSNTLTTFSTDNYVWDRNFKVRELTERESFRLMGLEDESIDKVMSKVPEGKCRRLSGNSICVDVLSGIFRKMFTDRAENPETPLF